MAIVDISGNILNSKMDYTTITVNCVGAMGAGIARAFRDREYDLYLRYKTICIAGKLKPGMLMSMTGKNGRNWLMFPTKDDWKHPSQTLYIEQGLNKLRSMYREKGIHSLAMPMLGCRNGGLKRGVVYEMIYDYLEELDDLKVELYV